MKKMTLVFTILCAGQLYCMEKPKPDYMANLPREVQGLIIVNLQTGKDLDSTIRTLIATSRTNKALNQIINEMYGNLKGFTALVHILANKFNIAPGDVRDKFKTPASEEYLNLIEKLQTAINNNDIAQAKQAIEQGADVNYSWQHKIGPDNNIPTKVEHSFLYLAVERKNLDMIKLLLNAGANPNLNPNMHRSLMSLSNYMIERERLFFADKKIAQDIGALLEEAIKK